MMLHEEFHMTVTRWPWTGSAYGPAQVFAPNGPALGARWSIAKQSRLQTDSKLRGQVIHLRLSVPLQIFDCVALGDHSGAQPQEVPTVHQVIGVTETHELPPFEGSVYRMTCEPLLALMRHQVSVYPVVETEAGRSFTRSRGNVAYSGQGTVDIVSGPAEQEVFAQRKQGYQATVTIPYGATLQFGKEYEVDYASPNGSIRLRGSLNSLPADSSPFLTTLSCEILA